MLSIQSIFYLNYCPFFTAKEMKDEIETALNDIQNHTCLRFKNAEKDDNRTGVLVFIDGPG